MKLLFEAFILNNVSDIQRQLLDSGSPAEKITTAADIIDNNKSGNVDVSKFKDIVVQAIIRYGVTDNNPFIRFLNSSGAAKFSNQLTAETAQSVLDILIDADQNVEKIFYGKDIGIFEGSKADIQYKLKVIKVFTDKTALNTYKNDSGDVLTLPDIMNGDVLKDTSEIRKILDTYYTDNEKEDKKEKIPLIDILKKNKKDYKKDPTGTLDFLSSFFIDTKYSKNRDEAKTKENLSKIDSTLIVSKLDSIFKDDGTGKKVENFISSVEVDYPAGVTDIIGALVLALDDTKGGTMISGNQLVADQVGATLQTLSVKDLNTYVILLAETSNVDYIKANLSDIQKDFQEGTYNKELRELCNTRYKITKDSTGKDVTIQLLNERIARLLQDIYLADTTSPINKEK